MVMICRRVQSTLSAYIDGELPLLESVEVREHLEECARCRAEEDGLRSARRMARVWGVYQPDTDLKFRLDPALLAERARLPERIPWWERLREAWISLPLPATGLAASAAAVLLAWGVSGRLNAPAVARHPAAAPVRVAVLPRTERVAPPVVLPPAVTPAPKREDPPAAEAVPADQPETTAATAPPAASAQVRRPAHRAHSARRQRQRALRTEDVARAEGSPASMKAARHAEEPVEAAAALYAQGHVNRAVAVLNEAIERSTSQSSLEARALAHEQNSVADADISECAAALRDDPGNVNARKFLDKAYTTKVALLRPRPI